MHKFRSNKSGEEVEAFVVDEKADQDGVMCDYNEQYLFVYTDRGVRCRVSHGDWVVPLPNGSHYRVYKPHEFEAEFESITPERKS